MTIERFVVERDGALTSLDKGQIVRFIRNWSARIPIPTSDDQREWELFWRTVHKARLMLNTIDAEERAFSLAWLRRRGSGPPPEADIRDIPGTVDESKFKAWLDALEYK